MGKIETLTPDNTPEVLHPHLADLNWLYQKYLTVMALKARQPHLDRVEKSLAWSIAFYNYLCDVWFNITTASKIFNDRARELTVTARLKRYRREGTPEQQAIAEFMCDQILDKDDPDGNHC